MELKQNDLERLTDHLQRGLITVEQANVEMVRIKRVRLVIGSMPAAVRKSLGEAVKRGELGHMAKDKNKPEAYFHPSFEYIARQERRDHERNALNALAGVLA